MSDAEDLSRENEALRARNDELLRRLDDAERALAASHAAAAAPQADAVAEADAIRRSEARFRVMLEKSAEGISLTAADGTSLFRSAAVAHIVGFTPDELNARPLMDSALPEDRPLIRAHMEMLLAGQRDIHFEYRAVHRDGSLRWIEASGTNLLDDPNVGALVGNFRDITARKAADEALRASEERYHRLIEDLPEPVPPYAYIFEA